MLQDPARDAAKDEASEPRLPAGAKDDQVCPKDIGDSQHLRGGITSTHFSARFDATG